jgi:DNA-directed RNA polymerase sigma subunit (sigma70/sigma32)
MRVEDRKLLESLILKANLDDHQFVVVAKRYGLDEKEPMKVFQIAQMLGVTDEQVRKLTRIALFKLRDVSDDKPRFDNLLAQLTIMRPRG